MRRRQRGAMCASLVVLAAATSACHTITEGEVMGDVRQAVSLGMPIDAASEAMTGIGFHCSSNYDVNFTAGDVTCTRNGGSGYILSGCLQRVFLDLNRQRRVYRIHDATVSCAGL